MTTLFQAFIYLGARPHASGGEPKLGGVVPSVIESETDYLFNRKADGQAERVALEVLPTRLRLLGFEVLSGPKADGTGFVFLDRGGPLFLIKARKGQCILSIEKRSAKDTSAGRSWRWDREVWEAGAYLLSTSGSGCRREIAGWR